MRVYLIAMSIVLCLMGIFPLSAATIYNESISGDLSNNGLAPTLITAGPGSNQILGTDGWGTTMDRDYLTFTVPNGFVLSGIGVLPGTQSGGAVSFIGLEAGKQITLPTNAADATGLLGWWHFSPSDINTDILAKMAISSTGSSGFSTPLPAGSYSLWIQDFNAGSFAYGFDLQIQAVQGAAAPEPGTALLVLGGFAVIPLLRHRSRRRP